MQTIPNTKCAAARLRGRSLFMGGGMDEKLGEPEFCFKEEKGTANFSN